MPGHDIVVIGSSAGGLAALSGLASRLPGNLQAAVFMVWHISPYQRSILPEVLNRAGTLPAAHAVDREPIACGKIYVAPPDYHLVLEAGHVRLTKGPKENRFRPAVDTLFRSAAYAFGARVIGIVLSGALDDGTAGLWAIKDRGGIAVVQDPEEAEQASMPLSARQNVRVDYCLGIAQIAEILPGLVEEPALAKSAHPAADALRIETRVALEENAPEHNVMRLGAPSIFTCPDCRGVLVQVDDGSPSRFRCHTRHAFSARSLLAGMNESAESALWNTLRVLEEAIMLLEQMSESAKATGQYELARLLADKIEDAKHQGDILRKMTRSQSIADIDHAPERN